MKDITDEVNTLYSSKYLATILNISPITLKKYSLLIEKLSKGAVQFSRNDDKSRNYTDTDVLLIKRTLLTREKEGLSYENAVIKVLQEENILDVPGVQIGVSPIVPLKTISDDTVKSFISVLNDQNDRIEKLIESQEQLLSINKAQAQQVQSLLEQNELLLEKIRLDSIKESTPDKKTWKFWK